jgi:hypothetical protein
MIAPSHGQLMSNSKRSGSRFTWFDGLILGAFATAGLYASYLVDGEFLEHLHIFQSYGGLGRSLPEWFEDLELSAKRTQFDFLAFLTVISPGVALVMFRRVSAWRWTRLPAPGIAAVAATVLALAHKVLERIIVVSHRDPLTNDPGLLWIARWGGFWSAMDWWRGMMLYQIQSGVTGAILGVWTYLVLARAWKARDDWIDCLGRWLGWCWLGNLVFHPLAQLIWG